MKDFKSEKSVWLRDRVLASSFLFVLILETLFLLMKATLNAEVVHSLFLYNTYAADSAPFPKM